MSSTRRESIEQKSARPRHTKPGRAAASSKSKAPVVVAPAQRRWWPWLLAIVVAAIAVFEIYVPTLHGPFLLDDTYGPYMRPDVSGVPFRVWLMGNRPLLGLSFWLNYQWSQQDPCTYHLINVLLHLLNGGLVFAILYRVLRRVDVEHWKRVALSTFGAALFLAHPLQTESVAYVASRSETLSVFFAYLAFAVFLWRRSDAISWPSSIAVVAAFGAACLTKEHTVILPALLLLTDYFWNPGFSFSGIRRNWRLYVPLAALAMAAGVVVLRLLTSARTAGFRMQDLTWYQYFFTQCRAIWIYLAKFIVPIRQNIDYDFPISRSITAYGALFGLLGLVAVSAAAWIYRRRFPLASYGWFAFLILIAPTSSFAPIRDPLVERRLYLPFIGLLFIVMELLRRWRASRTVLVSALSVVIALEAVAAYNRNQLWGDAAAMWQDAVAKSPGKERPEFQLASLYYSAGRCAEAADTFAKARPEKPDDALLLDWGLALQCAGRGDEAVAKLREAVTVRPGAHAYTQLAMVYAQQGRYPEALKALHAASTMDPNYDLIYYYRGTIYFKQGDPVKAVKEYHRGLELNPGNTLIRGALAQAEAAAGPGAR